MREIAAFDGDVAGMVPAAAIRGLSARLRARARTTLEWATMPSRPRLSKEPLP